MAIDWKPIDNQFGTVMESALSQAKQLAQRQLNLSNGFGGRYYTPEEYYSNKINRITKTEPIVQESPVSSIASSVTETALSTPLKAKHSALYGENFNKYAPTIIKEAQAQNIDPNALLTMTYIESKFDPNTSNSKYGGLHQINKAQHANWADPEYNTKEAVKLYKANEAYAKKNGIPFDAGTAYLYHQQGIGGATALLKNPNLSAAEALKKTPQWKNKDISWINKNVIESNGGKAGMSAGEFANLWRSKATNVYNSVRAREAQLGSWANYLNNGGYNG